MMCKKRLSFKAMFLSLTLMILSSASSPQLAHSAKTVEIGVIAPNGIDNYAAIISIANDDINDYIASKGLDYRFTYIIEDAQGNAAVHLEHVKNFKSMGTNLLIGGGWSTQAQTSLTYVNNNEMLLFSPSSTTVELSIPNDNLFRLALSERWYNLAEADAMWSLGIDAAIVLYPNTRAGDYDQFVDDFRALGGEEVHGYDYEAGTSDFHDVVSRVEAEAMELADVFGREHVGLLLLTWELQDIQNIIRVAMNFPTIYNLKWFTRMPKQQFQNIIEVMPSEAEHLKLFSVEQHLPDTSKAKDVEDRFVSLIGMPFNVYTANLYDICWIYALSIFSTDSVNAITIKNVLPDIAAGYNGITGNCELDGKGDRSPYKFDVWGIGETAGTIQPVKYAYYDYSTKETVWNPIPDDNVPPVAVINGPYSGEETSSISFSSAGSHDPDGNIVEYRWDFGDDQTSTNPNPSHTYEEAGTYTVTLRVTDNKGANNIATTACTVKAAPPGFPWLPVLAVLIVVAAAAGFLYLQKMKSRVMVRKPVELNIGIEPEAIPADGKSTSVITIELLDDEGKPYEAKEDTTVTLSTTGGVLVSSREVKKDEATGAMTITDSVRQAVESLLTQKVEGGTHVSIKQGETSVEAAIVSALEVGDVTLTVSAPGVRKRTVRIRFTEKRRYCMHCGASMSIEDRACPNPNCGLMPPSGVDVKSCPNCGEVIPSQARFCSECGAGQPSPQ